MGALVRIVGQQFGNWTVISRAIPRRDSGSRAMWTIRCECGAERAIAGPRLKKSTPSCSACNPRHGRGHGVVNHGYTSAGKRSPVYSSWANMIARCTYPSNPAFAHYQRRGITVCDRWRDFRNFLADMGERPSPNHTLDRIDNNGNYEPGNVRWATKREQANNRVTNIRFDYRGKSYTMAELARATGVNKDLLRGRLCRRYKAKWTVEGAVEAPAYGRKGFHR